MVRARLGAALFVISAAIAVGGSWIWLEYRPDGPLLGRPTRIPACVGRDYHGGGTTGSTETLDQIRAGMSPGLEPTVLEPVLGLIPLLSPLSGRRTYLGNEVCDTVIWLHVGPDAYAAYELSGGP